MWYQNANEICRELDRENPDRAAGVIAALSPQIHWNQNVALAIRAYTDGTASGCFGNSCRNANRILNGEDWRVVLNGKKTRNFAALISNPNDSESVCVDRHAFDIAVGEKTNEKNRKALDRVGVYERFADAYRSAAAALGILPSQAQAISWVVWREIAA